MTFRAANGRGADEEIMMRRPPRTLPGTDALLFYKISLGLFLAVAVVILALAVATAAEIDARVGPLGHLPWPLAQWALTTPLGTLAVALVAGLACGLPLALAGRAARTGWLSTDVVDVTELPPSAWPARWPWRRPGGPTLAEYWLGRGWRQRVLSLLALALAVLLALGFFAAYGAVGWYGRTHLPVCSGSRCPPSFGQLLTPPLFIGVAIVSLIEYRWVRQVERRCGVWFRVPDGAPLNGVTGYVRRPGVTAEGAAAELARATRGVMGRPVARRAFVTMLFFVPLFLVLIALGLLIAWLPTQWIPA
jgi:hypothetical protein